ncbi:glycosyl hydrolases family 31-domain-containing protein [Stachybotrys elegans]|uniref:Glycosyl hydrolases family 31-domain-containing protein n=1 Tax=Stachybotrys elegans TaxID=80388 RepID=A0A8K0T2R1_9HYPO|nr:glycosyl hydrolases family 31-domain-containing protein [Stachybotrys elegans]
MFAQQENRLVFSFDAEQLWIEPWGPNALRIRATKMSAMPDTDWALLPPGACEPEITITDDSATLANGRIRAVVSKRGKLTVWNSTGKLLLEEYARNRRDVTDPKCSALEVEAREFRPNVGGDYRLTARFESLDPKEKMYGMGQYQQPHLDIKGHQLELAHRNSQASVPFLVSSRGYGFLWNNPAIGNAILGKNIISFEALSTKALDYWVVAGDTPAQIVEAYANATGKVPMMPEYGLGFWQCKLRYQTQEELLEVAREYKRRKLPIDLIVIDFFHWPKQGDWKFDTTYWPDPDAMIAELKSLNIELMVSIWPTVDRDSENFDEMLEKGYLIRSERGVRTVMHFQGNTVHFDATNPVSRDYVWSKAKQNYYSKGIKVFWLDEAEPEYDVYDFDNWRYHLGANTAIGNIYPREYSRAFYEGMTAEGQTNIVNLVRCAWAGSQKFGALVWSGDIASSWSSFRDQLAAGLNMGMSGLPWWTTDIGGFHGGDPNDAAFRELMVRWFQWGTFCPVMRLHGDREPKQPQHGTTGGATCLSGAPNEVWSYGPEVYDICKTYLHIREDMRAYTRGLMREAHDKGTPVIRTLFYEFPHDKMCWEVEEQYMYGDKYLCCPVLEPGQRRMEVYLPNIGGKWKSFWSEAMFSGGETIEVDCPLDKMPIFVRR